MLLSLYHFFQISRVTREARNVLGAKGPMSEESDMDIREIRDRNRSISKAIGQILQQVYIGVFIYLKYSCNCINSFQFKKKNSSEDDNRFQLNSCAFLLRDT